jgi:hypothetical protein
VAERTVSIGDRVKLKSGSPDMLVVDFKGAIRDVTVAYRDKRGIFQEFDIPDVCLRVVRRSQAFR